MGVTHNMWRFDMSDFNIGDIVRIGKGIEWTIVEITNTNDVKIQTH